jgi:hypothetical protein
MQYSRIDIGRLERGMYFMRIRNDKGKLYTGKVVKQY